MLLAGVLAIYVAGFRSRARMAQYRAEVQYAVASTLQQHSALADAAPRLLREIGEPLGFVVGGLWEVRADRMLRCVRTWRAPGAGAQKFEEVTGNLTLAEGQGVPGRVLESGAAVWFDEVTFDRELPRADPAAEVGLRSAVAFPLRTSGGVVGVIELFSKQSRQAEGAVLDLLGAVGGQIAEFLEASRSATALRESEARKAAMLEAALDLVVTIDHRGHVLELNPAAVEALGYEREEAVGREMAELIVPPDLRAAHRKALKRCVETGEGSLLGKRVELRAMRRDGSEFPVEITITRIGESDPPMFTGFMRDITTRKAYEEERERLLELERIARLDADQSRGQLAAILSGVADAVTAQAPDGRLLFANESAVETLGFDSVEELLAAPVTEIAKRFEPLDEDGEAFPTERLPGRIALQEGRSAEDVIRFRDPRDGSERWSRVKATPVRGENGEVAMAINVIEDVTELKRTEHAQRLLAEAGRLLASSLDTEAILQRVASLATSPWLADWCSVHVLDPDGNQTIAAWAASDAERGQALMAIAERYPPDPQAALGVPNVFRTGESELYPEVLPEHLDRSARDEEHRRLIEETGTHSIVLAPIASRGVTLGAITLARFGGGRRYDDEDVSLLEELGRRIGGWLDTAQHLRRAQLHRQDPPGEPPARSAPGDPGTPHRGALPGERRRQRGRRRLLRPVPVGGGELVGRGGRRVREGPGRRGGHRACALHAASGGDDRARAERGSPGAQRRAAPAAQGPPLRHRGLRLRRPPQRRDGGERGERGPSAPARAARRRHRSARGQRGNPGRCGAGSRPRRRQRVPPLGRLARVLHRRGDRGARRGRDAGRARATGAARLLRRHGRRWDRRGHRARGGGDAGGRDTRRHRGRRAPGPRKC